MRFLLMQLLVQIPFEIPETLIYKPPESLFIERMEITKLENPQIFSISLSNCTAEIKSPWAIIQRGQLPVNGPDGRLAKTSFTFNLEKTSLSLLAGVTEREYGNFISAEDSIVASFTWKNLFIFYKTNSWFDYFPKVDKKNVKSYSTASGAIGFKIKNKIAPYIIVDRVNRKQKVYFGVTWLSPDGYAGFQVKDNKLNALFLNFTLNNTCVKFEFDRSDYQYTLLPYAEYVPFDSSLLNRKLSTSSTIKTAITLDPFYFCYERHHFNNATVQDTSNLHPIEARNFTETVYNFGIKSDNFALFYTHFQSPYSVIKDTLLIALFFTEKYYDFALYFNFRNHQEEFNMLNLELRFKAFRNISPYLKVINLFDVQGEYLPNIKAKRRYMEIGCRFQKEF